MIISSTGIMVKAILISWALQEEYTFSFVPWLKYNRLPINGCKINSLSTINIFDVETIVLLYRIAMANING